MLSWILLRNIGITQIDVNCFALKGNADNEVTSKVLFTGFSSDFVINYWRGLSSRVEALCHADESVHDRFEAVPTYL